MFVLAYVYILQGLDVEVASYVGLDFVADELPSN